MSEIYTSIVRSLGDFITDMVATIGMMVASGSIEGHRSRPGA